MSPPSSPSCGAGPGQASRHALLCRDQPLPAARLHRRLRLAPERDEAEIAAALRAASPSATPNPRLVAIADGLLGRSGRMVAAIAAIGRGAEAFEGVPFTLALA